MGTARENVDPFELLRLLAVIDRCLASDAETMMLNDAQLAVLARITASDPTRVTDERRQRRTHRSYACLRQGEPRCH